MEKAFTVFKVVFAAVGGWLIGALGGWDKWLMALVIFATVDVLSGLLKAFLKKSDKSDTGAASSSAMGKGIAKKGFMFLIVGLSVAADKLIGNGEGIIRNVVISYYVATEALSIIENALLCGIPIPDKLKSVFEVMKNKSGTVLSASTEINIETVATSKAENAENAAAAMDKGNESESEDKKDE